MIRNRKKKLERHSHGRYLVELERLDTLGRSNANKRGPNNTKPRTYSKNERRLLDTYGKYVKIDGYTYETLKVHELEHKFNKI